MSVTMPPAPATTVTLRSGEVAALCTCATRSPMSSTSVKRVWACLILALNCSNWAIIWSMCADTVLPPVGA